MTIHDLTWTPARIGAGFCAVHSFPNGITVHVRCCSLSGADETYRASVIGRDGRLEGQWSGLDRDRLNKRLTWTEMRPRV